MKKFSEFSNGKKNKIKEYYVRQHGYTDKVLVDDVEVDNPETISQAFDRITDKHVMDIAFIYKKNLSRKQNDPNPDTDTDFN